MQRGGRFCVERVKFVKFGEREGGGGGVRREELGVDWAAKPLRPAGRAGEAREESLPCQREVPSASEAEGFLAVCGCNGRRRKARRTPPVT